ncbi:hypothetical protein BBD42_19755 [Paenibacillus sp. BIHB 4019]|uniref:Ketoreductase domain-containing protein n=1 Tax=Paenibacillus sp. BIHB 4019 TaxID=1870819 RepID=A0A1B2DL85_9BACL|nr:glucose 1-dehydrogenase [Paenibacillus sp. BIHB 4019]ANY68459.1 hypothetical protein BBD42_19755 [Paenibacillus sp. BIHB 4019]
MKRLQNKVALVTGAAGGIGAAIAAVFAAEGAKVVLTDLSEAALKETAEAIRETGGDVYPLAQDVSSEQQWQHVIQQAVQRYGKLNILVNNAGIASPFNVEEETVERWDKVQSVNSRGVFLGLKYAVPEIRKAGGGSIINISSIFGIIGAGGEAAYHASKGAVRLLTKTTAIDLAKDFIRVNSIHPGMIETPMTEHKLANPAGLEAAKQVTPWPRLGKPTDIAYGALYLASDESTFVTGSELVIDGGWVAH